MTEASDKAERYYQGKHGAPVPWMKPDQKRPDPPKSERVPLNIQISRAIKLGVASTKDVWRSGFIKNSKESD